MQVGASLIRFIKGKGYTIQHVNNFVLQLNIHFLIIFFPLRGSTQRKIEEEMGVKIIFPSSKKDDSISKFGFLIIYVNLVYGHYDKFCFKAFNRVKFLP